ncbi:MAG TPA: acyl-CoA dehydratase activase [Syntrophorhabdaceae bacterium]|jgi:predicted CoA-substrate-specific enzyme activase|nr:rod shape-determining protein [Syntrophorhabdaceae bacterium]MDI9560499.1 acyl-CoA dehydratase activase [Pseudomonadota bacterium]MBV6506150.1 2-hydroxyisocaproyl-CoA dehydratase activator [Syntrophorhabdaceae bacterium]HNQ63618.1 acyl-CoA dehydratase activase [Syntrophorhabdaceae bacterium]HNZ58899.1 acyl-CoA dehydratase activase [Syntrophorhabdaceae bacterium]
MKRYFAGLDIGSTMTKVVVIGDSIEASIIGPTGPEHRKLANKVMEDALIKAHLAFEDLSYIVATGYGRINVPFADRQITEITCHAKGLFYLLPTVKTIVDIGGQDSKGIKIKDGKVNNFVMNDKCAAGTGRFLEVIADSLNVPLERLGEISISANRAAEISSTCTVFAEHEVTNQLANGESVANLIAGVHMSVATRVSSLVKKLQIEKDIAITGGGAKNIGLVKALEEKFGCPVLVPPEPLITGALGAAIMGKEIFEKFAREGQTPTRSGHGLEEARFFS